jgi:tetratricopeptide (TPR) repeat protein
MSSTAEQVVEAGNQLFKEKKYAEAIQRYTQALEIDSSPAQQIRVCNNRAQCYLFLVRDCCKC